jgi:hypothetical protein
MAKITDTEQFTKIETKKVNYKRIIVSFLIAYIGVSVLNFGLYLVISQIIGTSPWDETAVKDNTAYNLTEKFLPLINLVVWTLCAGIYFKGRRVLETSESFKVGIFWLVPALIIDLVGFVLIKHPLSVDAKGFYVDQFPWIYLTYIAVFVAPYCYTILKRHYLCF